MSHRLLLLSVVIGLGLAGGARAQGLASNAEEPRAGEEVRGDTRVAEIDEIERGFYVGVDYGPNYYLFLNQPGFVPLNQDFLKPGTRIGIRAGYDILNNIRADVFLLANFNEGVINVDDTAAGVLTGDLAHLAPGLALRFDYITTEDQRFFAYVRAGAGFAFWFPSVLALDDDARRAEVTAAAAEKRAPRGPLGSVHVDAALGIEYYTRLRHLSVGLEVDGQGLLIPFAFGLQVYPTLKYTF